MSERRNPYVGPRAFESGERLYGRDVEARNLLNRLIAQRIVLLYAPSGAGKTSLIQARLVPDLRREGFTPLPPMRVNQPPPLPDADNRYVLSLLLSLEENVPEAQQVPLPALAHMDLNTYLAEHAELWAQTIGPVLFFDQFEEILTLNPVDREEKEDFFAKVGAALADQGRWALFAMREDFVAGLDPYRHAIPTRLNTTYRLDFLKMGAAREAIQKPARDENVEFQALAADRLMDDLGRVRVQQPDGSTVERVGDYIEPVQLQVVCRWLWQRLPADAQVITPKTIEALEQAQATDDQDVSNVDRALAGYYAEQVSAVVAEIRAEDAEAAQNEDRSVDPAPGVNERAVREWFARELITPQGIRGQVLLDRRRSNGLHNRAIWKLVSAHLVRAEQRRGATWFELAHDRLIEPVKRANAAWRTTTLHDFQRRAAEWDEKGQPPRLLLRAVELEQAEAWAAEHPGLVVPLERAYLDESHAAIQESSVERSIQAELRTDLSALGWGVIFAAQDERSAAIREALAELLEHRRREAAREHPGYYHEFTGGQGYRPGESASQFLARHGVGASIAAPDKMPYYLLIMGGPETIPFEFQYNLDVQYAVGRLDFGDDLRAYASYARSVVQAETGEIALPRRAAFFSPQHPGDRPTQLSTEYLVKPLAEALEGSASGWEIQRRTAEEATKAALSDLLGGDPTPALLFAAGRGMENEDVDDPQLADRGALICQDWPGRQESPGQVLPAHYFGADDVRDDARLLGLIALLVAPSSAGVPHRDDFAHRKFEEPKPVAPRAFVARLPQQLLGHPRGGALAVIGHVQTLWSRSFVSESEALEYGVFESALRRLMMGHTVGSAMDALNQRYAQLSAQLSEALQRFVFQEGAHARPDPELVDLMTATRDARNYIVLGDPAVRLPALVAAAEDVVRPAIEAVAAPEVSAVAGAGLESLRGPGMPSTEALVFNGINGATGGYLFEPVTPAEMAKTVQQERSGHRPIL